MHKCIHMYLSYTNRCVYIYIHVYTHVYLHICMYIQNSINQHIDKQMNIYTYKYMLYMVLCSAFLPPQWYGSPGSTPALLFVSSLQHV